MTSGPAGSRPSRWSPAQKAAAYQAWWASQRDLVVRAAGTAGTGWTGQVSEVSGVAFSGVAGWDGVMYLRREDVTEPIQQMFRHAGERHSGQALRQFRWAAEAVLHEQAHFLVSAGQLYGAGSGPYEDPARPSNRILEEGVTGKWAMDNLNDHLRATGLDKVAPGITRVRNPMTYPQFVPAAEQLVKGLAKQTGLRRDAVLNTLAKQGVAEKWSTAADLVFRSSDLPQVVQPSQHRLVKNAIENAMRDQIDKVDGLGTQNLSPRQLRRASARLGREAVRAGEQVVQQQLRARDPLTHSPVRVAAAGVSPMNSAGRLPAYRAGSRSTTDGTGQTAARGTEINRA